MEHLEGKCKSKKMIMMAGNKFFTLFISVLLISASGYSQGTKKLAFHGKESFLVEGTAFPESEKENTYDRLPLSYKEKVRPPVWELSKSSAGITARFVTNSGSIGVRWELLFNTRMNHMAETGIKGIDLYCKTKDGWRYVNTARPVDKLNEAVLVNNLPQEMTEYMLYLPLYDGIASLEVGTDSLSVIHKADRTLKKPIVFYGTSITQGGCASRPGMAYTNIISRKLATECINFGFSGNGRMEQPVVEAISGIDASFFVIDCIPNMSSDEVVRNTAPLVETIRRRQPAVPIVFVECMIAEKSNFDGSSGKLVEKNKALRNEYDRMIKNGIKNIYYISNEGLLGNDHEATVDGVHFTDLGFMRFADNLVLQFRKFRLVK